MVLCIFLLAILSGVAASPPYGPPCNGNPACIEYENRRQVIIDAESNLAFDADTRVSAKELAVGEHLAALRASDLEVMAPLIPGARNFREAMPVVEQKSTLLPILKKMPKGGILHSHGIGSADNLVRWGTYDPRCYMCTGRASRDFGVFRFGASPPAPTDECSKWENVVKLRGASSDVKKFDKDIFNSLQFFTPSRDVSEDDMWVTFDRTLGRVGSLASYLPLFRKFFYAGLEALLKDGVMHLEIRGIPYLFDEDGKELSKEESLAESYAILDAFNADHGTSLSLLFIHIGLKSQNATEVYSLLEEAVVLRRNHSDTVVGFDLVDEEDRFHRIIYFRDDFLRIKEFIAAHDDLPLPYFFHAGETAWHLEETSNLYDAYLLNSSRVGHGFALREYPVLMQLYIEKGISLEVCPVSNQMLRLLDDIRDHSAVTFMAEGVSISISPDDPIIYGYEGVTWDFYMAHTSWNLTISALKTLVFNSISESAAADDAKAQMTASLETQWGSWVDAVFRSIA